MFPLIGIRTRKKIFERSRDGFLQLSGPVVLSFFLAAMFQSCVNDNLVPVKKAQKRVLLAQQAGMNRCDGDPPVEWIVVLSRDVRSSELLECENALLTMSCPPPSGVPPYCLYIMVVAPGARDIDGI